MVDNNCQCVWVECNYKTKSTTEKERRGRQEERIQRGNVYEKTKKRVRDGQKERWADEKSIDQQTRLACPAQGETNSSVCVTIMYGVYMVCLSLPVMLPGFQCMTIIFLQTVWTITKSKATSDDTLSSAVEQKLLSTSDLCQQHLLGFWVFSHCMGIRLASAYYSVVP